MFTRTALRLHQSVEIHYCWQLWFYNLLWLPFLLTSTGLSLSLSPSSILSSCASLSSFLSLGPPNCGLFVFAMHFIIVSIMCFERRLCVLSRPDWTNCTSNSLLNDLQSLCVQSDWFMNNILNSMLSTSNNKTDNLLDYIFSVFPFFRYFFWIDSGLRKCAKLKRYMATMVAN